MNPFISRVVLLLAAFLSIINWEAIGQSAALSYHTNINLAELAICAQDFRSANHHYKKAFSFNRDKPFTRDLHNAFFSAMDAAEYRLAEEYLALLLKRGLSQSFIKEKIFSNYPGEYSRLQELLSRHYNDTISTDPIVHQIKDMLQWDQRVRLHYSALNNGAYIVDSVYTVDSINAARLMKIFIAKGLLNETYRGIGLLHGFAPAAAPGYDILIFHHNGGASGGRPSQLFDSLLFSGVQTLDYSPHSFAQLLQVNSSSVRQFGATTITLPLSIGGFYFNRRIYPAYSDTASEKQINNERAKIGLESLDDLRAKIEAVNQARNRGSKLAKYMLVTNISLQDGRSEKELEEWLGIHVKNARPKNPYRLDHSAAISEMETIEIGKLGSIYAINKTLATDRISYYERILKEYYAGKIPLAHWSGRQPPLSFNYHAEIIRNDTLKTTNDTQRYNKARMVPGYRLMAEHSMGLSFGFFKAIELLYYHDTLFHFSAIVDTAYYKLMTRKFGNPQIEVTRDTVKWPQDMRYNVILTNRNYIWNKHGISVEITVADKLDDKGKKITTALFQMMDKEKFLVYRRKVEAQFRALKK